MSYGQNQPAGLVAIYNLNGSPYNGQTTQHFIQSGYASNIFRGDLVYKGPDGFIHNLADLGNSGSTAYQNVQSWGVFNSCSYVQPTANNPTDPANPGRPFWPAGTVTANGVYATCNIIDDPNVIFTIQSDQTGVPWNAQSACASVGYTYISGNNPNGNMLTGQSSMILVGSTINSGNGTNLLNLRIRSFDPNPSNPIPLPGGGSSPYVNVLVVIENHSFIQRAVGQ